MDGSPLWTQFEQLTIEFVAILRMTEDDAFDDVIVLIEDGIAKQDPLGIEFLIDLGQCHNLIHNSLSYYVPFYHGANDPKHGKFSGRISGFDIQIGIAAH